MNKDEQRRDMVLNGNLWKVILVIAFPVIVFNLINAFYNVFDASIASNIGSNEVSAVAALSQIKNVLSSVGVGLAAGGSIIVARNLGAGLFDTAKKATNVLFSISSIIVVLLLVICIPGAKVIMRLSNVNEELISIGTGYFIVSIIDLAFLFFNNIFIGLQKAKANTKSIFYVNLMGMIIKLSLSIIFVYGFKVDNIIWVAIATMTSQIVIFIIAMTIMMSKKNSLQVSFKSFSLQKDLLKKILIISFPIFIGKFVFMFGKVIMNGMCMEYGTLVVGALAVSGNIGAIGVMMGSAFEEIESGIVSQNLGNRNIKRAVSVFLHSIVISVSIGIVGYILIKHVFLQDLLRLFTQNAEDQDNAQFIKNIQIIFFYESWSIISLPINSTCLGLLYGFGQTKLTMIVNICRVFVFRIPLLFIFQTFFPHLGVEGVGLSMGISNVGIAVLSLSFLLYFLYKTKKQGYQGMYFDNDQKIE